MEEKRIKKSFSDFIKENESKNSETINKILNEMELDNEFDSEKFLESSLTRVWQHSEKYDVAIITAFRDKEEYCYYKDKFDQEKEYTLEENKERNKQLKSVLLKKRYGITNIKGSYIENFETPKAIEVKEDSFFVVNFNNDPDFKDVIYKLGRYFCQDCILYKEKDKDAVLIGTNYSDYPGYNKVVRLGKFNGGREGEFYSRVNGRPFLFESFESHNVGGKYVIDLYSKDIIKELGI